MGSRLLRGLLTVVLGTLLIIGASIWTYAETDETRPADVAIVLGAGTAQGQVSPVYAARLDHAVWLYQEDYVDMLILTGGMGEGNTISDAAAARDYVLAQGVAESAVLLEETSTITEENLVNAKAIMDEQGFKTALIVSDPLHMKRAMTMAEDYGLDAWSSPTTTSQYQSLKTKLPFLCREVFFYVGYRLSMLFR